MKSSREYKIILLPEAEKFYRKLFRSDKSHFLRIKNALFDLQSDPMHGKPLRHLLKGKYSLRVGIYRIIYSIDHGKITVFVLDIGHRKDIYD